MRNIVSIFTLLLCAFVIVAVMPADMLTDDNSAFAVIRGPTVQLMQNCAAFQSQANITARLITAQDQKTMTAVTRQTQQAALAALNDDNFANGRSSVPVICNNYPNPFNYSDAPPLTAA